MTEAKLEFERNENVASAENAQAKFRPSQLAWAISGRVVEYELSRVTSKPASQGRFKTSHLSEAGMERV